MRLLKNISLAILSICLFCECSESVDGPVKVTIDDSDDDFTSYVDYKDVLGTIYEVADELDMKVISDLSLWLTDVDKSGNFVVYSNATKAKISECHKWTRAYYDRFGSHKSFLGWYLNTEINPMKNSDPQSNVWRNIWRDLSFECHCIDRNAIVTISPFIILGEKGVNGVEYLEPKVYEEWWSETLKSTGIDVVMLQDSGAEHLSSFTLEQREKFFKAFSSACASAGSELWINVESGQINEETNKWEFTDMDWLAQKLTLAAKYGKRVINWGYFPYMNPAEPLSGMTVEDTDGNTVTTDRKANYSAYKNYYDNLGSGVPSGLLTQPKICGTLWFLGGNTRNLSGDELKKALRIDIENQKEAGFDILWLVNTRGYFQKNN